MPENQRNEQDRKQYQRPEPSVVAAIELAQTADAWETIVSILILYGESLLRARRIPSEDSGMEVLPTTTRDVESESGRKSSREQSASYHLRTPGGLLLGDYVQQSIMDIYPPTPTRGHEKKRAGESHGVADPISNTKPLTGSLAKHLTQRLESQAAGLEAQLHSTHKDSQRIAIQIELEALRDALCSQILHRLCRRICGIMRSNLFKVFDNAMNQALFKSKSFSSDSTDDEDTESRDAVSGHEMQRLSPNRPGETLLAKELLEKILLQCGDDAFLRALVQFKADTGLGRDRRAASIEEIVRASDGPFAFEPMILLTLEQRKIKIYKANEKLVTIKNELIKQGAWPS